MKSSARGELSRSISGRKTIFPLSFQRKPEGASLLQKNNISPSPFKERGSGGEVVSIYIHIPFCRSRCRYCDFNTYGGLEQLIPQYTQALLRELQSWKDLSLPVKSIYFGGGTPSLLSFENLEKILKVCYASFNIEKGAEITLEANPGTVTLNRLKNIKAAGVNRLSIGVQSFDDGLLKILGRLHNASEAREAIAQARKAGFDDISLDLMYGLPAQSLKQWEDSLKEAIELEPEHLSLYALTLEEETPLYRDINSGIITASDPDLAADMYLLAEDGLEKAGYVHYEISNWAMPGSESRHNLNYWQSGSYIGIGAAAHSYFNGERSWNVAHPLEYIQTINEQSCRGAASRAPEGGYRVPPLQYFRSIAAGSETITSEIEQVDYIILRLRIVEGIDIKWFTKKYGRDIRHLYRDEIASLKEASLLEEAGGRLRLTQKGRLLGNEVFQRFLPKVRV